MVTILCVDNELIIKQHNDIDSALYYTELHRIMHSEGTDNICFLYIGIPFHYCLNNMFKKFQSIFLFWTFDLIQRSLF